MVWNIEMFSWFKRARSFWSQKVNLILPALWISKKRNLFFSVWCSHKNSLPFSWTVRIVKETLALHKWPTPTDCYRESVSRRKDGSRKWSSQVAQLRESTSTRSSGFSVRRWKQSSFLLVVNLEVILVLASWLLKQVRVHCVRLFSQDITEMCFIASKNSVKSEYGRLLEKLNLCEMENEQFKKGILEKNVVLKVMSTCLQIRRKNWLKQKQRKGFWKNIMQELYHLQDKKERRVPARKKVLLKWILKSSRNSPQCWKPKCTIML